MNHLVSQSGMIRSEAGQRFVRRLCLFVAALLSGGNLILPRVPLLAALVLVAGLVLDPSKLLRPELGRIWLLLLVTLIVSLIGSEGLYLSATAVRYANFMAAIFLVIIYLDLPKVTLIEDLLPLLTFFAMQAILTPILAFLVPDAFIPFAFGEAIYYSLGLIFTYHDTVVATVKRADGFFFEPGVLQIYLNLYLFISLFFRRKPAHAALALVAVLATQSTTGIVIAVVMCVVAAWDYLRKSGVNDRLIILVLAPILLAPLAVFAQFNLDQKIVGELRGSTIARQYDLQAGLAIVRAYPVFGVGFDYDRYRDIAVSESNFRTEMNAESAAERTSSNGAILLMAMLGIPMFLVFMWGLFRQRLLPHKRLVFLLFLLSFIGEALILTPFFLLFILSGFLAPARRIAKLPQVSFGNA